MKPKYALNKSPAKAPAEQVVKDIRRQTRRWVVERTFAWLGRNRRLAKDFERTIESATTWLVMASVQMITWRIASL